MPKYLVERESEELIHKHASVGGFPANRISEITAAIDPNTARG